VRVGVCVLVLCACGRIAFDPLAPGDGPSNDGGNGSDAPGVMWPAFTTPQPAPISTTYDDWTPELSRDGLLLFGAAYNAPGTAGQDDLWMTKRATTGDAFAAWAYIPGLGTAGRDFGPALSPDGLTVFYGSGSTGFAEPSKIFQATRADLGSPFGIATEVTALTAGTINRDPALSADGLTIYFDSDRAPSLGGTDIWYATRASLTSAWSTPVSLSEVNSSSDDRDAYLSADGLTLYFASDRPGGIGGQDLWVTLRPDRQSPFAPPRNVMDLNSAYSEGNPTISDAGLIMWDASRPGGQGGTFGYDIWQAQLQ
jgi:hypothetical protein